MREKAQLNLIFHVSFHLRKKQSRRLKNHHKIGADNQRMNETV